MHSTTATWPVPGGWPPIPDRLDQDGRKALIEWVQDSVRDVPCVPVPAGERLPARVPTSITGEHAVLDREPLAWDARSGEVRLRLGPQPIVLALEPVGEGVCAWPALHLGDGRQGVVRRLRIGGEPPEETPVARRHPCADAILAALRTCDADEARWLLNNQRIAQDDWERALRTLVPAADHELDDLLAHPHAGSPGHWTQARLRRWIDGEPDLARVAKPEPDLFGPRSFDWIIRDTASSRGDRRRAWLALAPGHAPPARQPATVRAWCLAVARAGRLVDAPQTDDERLSDWLWTQPLELEDLELLGYERSLDGWATFLRQELGLAITIGAGVRTHTAVTSPVSTFGAILRQAPMETEPTPLAQLGARLGTTGLAERGLVVVRRGGAFELVCVDGREREPCLTIDWHDLARQDALTDLNHRLALRGLRAIEADPAVLDGAPVTMSCIDLPWRSAVQNLAVQMNARFDGRRLVRP